MGGGGRVLSSVQDVPGVGIMPLSTKKSVGLCPGGFVRIQ